MSRKRKGYPLSGMTGAQIRALQYRFERELEQFEKQLPALQREADRLHRSLSWTVQQNTVTPDDGAPLIFEQSLSYAFERVPPDPKSERPKCGARTRKGTPCAATVCLRPDGSAAKRCKLHGGKSTGPKSPEGRAAIAESNRRRRHSDRAPIG